MKVLVAGAGLFGREHLSRLHGRPDLILAAADPDAENLRKAEHLYGITDTGADALEMIDGFHPDAVIVATPAAAHVPIALAALEAGMPVLVEKPVAQDSEAAEKLVSAAEASSGFMLPGHVLRFCPWHQRLVELVVSGVIGEVLAIQSRRYRDASHATRYSDIDPIFMTLIHDIDLALWIDGEEPVEAEAVRIPAGSPRSFTSVRARSASGAMWELETAWLHPGECPPDRLQVVGALGTIELEPERHIRVHAERSEELVIKERSDPLRRELDWFLSAVATGEKEPPFSPRDAQTGLRVAEMFMGALR